MADTRAVVEAFFEQMADGERRRSVGELFADDVITHGLAVEGVA